MRQAANSVLLIEPVAFGWNPDSARTNAFMRESPDGSPGEIQDRARRELWGLVERLRAEGVEALVRRDSETSPLPDAIFPNNWVTFHEDGRVVLYPLEPPNRRLERRREILDWLEREHGFQIAEILDLSSHENEGRFLEGTGSMVFDRLRGIVYASISPRTTDSLLAAYAERFGLEVVRFHAFDSGGVPVYHTNVVLAVGSSVAVFCPQALRDEGERRTVLASLRSTGREVVEIDMEQLHAFVGNLLELRNDRGEPILALSERAFSALRPGQRETLDRHGKLVWSPIPTIEGCGGGSVRCMLAEVFLPRRRLSA